MRVEEVEKRAEKAEPLDESAAKKVVDNLIRLINECKSQIRLCACKGYPSGTTSLYLQLPSTRFFKDRSKVLVYLNEELPIFVGLSLDAFPELGPLVEELNPAEAMRLIREHLKAEGRTALLTWIVRLLEKDEKFRLLMESLEDLNSKVRKRKMEKENIRAIKKFLEAL